MSQAANDEIKTRQVSRRISSGVRAGRASAGGKASATVPASGSAAGSAVAGGSGRWGGTLAKPPSRAVQSRPGDAAGQRRIVPEYYGDPLRVSREAARFVSPPLPAGGGGSWIGARGGGR